MENGIDAGGKDKLKDVATKAGMRPMDLVEIIAGKEQ